jgi:hypothetical protein
VKRLKLCLFLGFKSESPYVVSCSFKFALPAPSQFILRLPEAFCCRACPQSGCFWNRRGEGVTAWARLGSCSSFGA